MGRAGFKRHVDGRAEQSVMSKCLPGLRECHPFRMRLTRRAMPAFSEKNPVLDDHGSHRRIRRSSPDPFPGLLKRQGHPPRIVHSSRVPAQGKIASIRISLIETWAKPVQIRNGSNRNPMKIRIACLSIALVSLQSAVTAEEPATTAVSAYQQGMNAIAAGDPVAAEASFNKALQQDPNNANARYQLIELRKNAPTIAAKGRATKFGAVMIPRIQLDGATLEESLAALSMMVTKESKDQVSPNFVTDDPSAKLASKTITLKLANVPAKAALEYILGQVGGKARFDEHAIVISAR